MVIVSLYGYLSNGGCACGCGYGQDGCIYAPLTTTTLTNTSDGGANWTMFTTTAWQSALVVGTGDDIYASAISCADMDGDGVNDADIYTELGLDPDDRCSPFLPKKGSFRDSCLAISSANAEAPCSSTDGLTFIGDGTDFGNDICPISESGGPHSYCTYQPPSVRLWFIFFMCAVPAITGLMAAWAAMRFPLSRASHKRVEAGIAAHKENASSTDPLTGVDVPVPVTDLATKEATAAYDHYSDAELTAAAALAHHTACAMSSQDTPDDGAAAAAAGAEVAATLLKGKVMKWLAGEVVTVIVLVVLVGAAAANDTTPNQGYLSVTVNICSLVASLVSTMALLSLPSHEHTSLCG
eukprot:SAG22_NODE_980_length_6173_cov_5.884261_3_plen_353_part_00